MNKFTLKFLNTQYEQQYQQDKMQKVRRYVFYLFMVLGLILNLSKILIDFMQLKPKPEIVNYALLGLFLVLLPISIKWPDKIQYTLAIGNISSGLLQLNFPDTTPPQRYYSYGSDFMQFQACAYFISDFQNSLVQLFFHTCMKLGFTLYLTKEVDPMLILMSVAAPIALSIVIYICDSNSRNQFLQNIKEDIWDQRLPELINKPFFRITYNDHMQHFSLIKYSCLEVFPGYIDEFCEGCNVRSLLRLYQDATSQSLQNALMQKKINFFNITHRGESFRLRVCHYGIERCNCIVILDRAIEATSSDQTPTIFKRITNYLVSRSFRNQQLFNWGVISILLINDKTIEIVDLHSLLIKLNQKFRRRNQIEFVIEGERVAFKGYTNMIRIYLIQIYLIMIQICEIKLKLQQQNEPLSLKLCINQEQGSVKLQLPSDQYDLIFLNEYQNNIFIQQVEGTILTYPMQQDLQISFNTYLPFL